MFKNQQSLCIEDIIRYQILSEFGRLVYITKGDLIRSTYRVNPNTESMQSFDSNWMNRW